MKEVQTAGEYKIFEKKSGRYAVKDSSKKYVNGDEKAKILADAGLIKIPEPKAAPVEEPEEASAEGEEAATDDAGEDAPAEDAE